MIKKGIILAGGHGTRMSPLTKAVNKQLLPIYDKPLIYYPLSVFMLAGIRDILIVVNKGQLNQFKKVLDNGKRFGVNIQYIEQSTPKGLPDAFILGQKFIGKDNVALILGDNIFYGIENEISFSVKNFTDGARIFAYNVPDPERYGVIEFNEEEIVSIEEKPSHPKSSYVITGLYFYDNNVIDIAKDIKPSNRNELEISDVNKVYLEQKRIEATKLQRGIVWLDAGTSTSLLQASQFVQTIQERQQINIGCLEEICWKNKLISDENFEKIVELAPNNSYGKYLKKIFYEKKLS